MELILASASERRKELLQRLTYKFDIIISNFDEEKVEFEGDCGKFVEKLAVGKALDVSTGVEPNKVVIGCDTIVAYNGKILGKPKNEEDAFSMLKFLSGNTHEVYSGIALINTDNMEIKAGHVCTKVKFSDVSDEEIRAYISTKEPMDKAGAYGIQGFGGVFVEEIHGCYYNVVGLPLNKLNHMLKEMGVNLK